MTTPSITLTGIDRYGFLLEVARGNIPGMSTVVIRGHNDDLDSGTEEDVWETGGDLTYMTSAETMEIASSSTSDDGDPAGVGLQTVLISGVSSTGALQTETITMNGTTDVTTSSSYLRVNSMTGLTAGSTGWNVGTVTATATTAATVQCQMSATEGTTQNSHYTVPLNKTLHVVQIELNAAKITGATPLMEFKAYVRPGGAGACWLQLFDKLLDTAVTDELDLVLPFPSSSTQATSRTDLRMRALSDTNNAECRTRMYGILIDD